MTKKLLATDTFFINDQDVAKLESAGYKVTHLIKTPAATEEDLVAAIQGVSVYIIGGIEQVTEAVIAAADKLEAIIFCGVDYDKFIPAAELAKSKGIEIYNAPGANAVAVTEFAIGVAIQMQRQLIDISRSGIAEYLSTRSIQGSTIGVIGAGNIGVKIIEAIKPFDPGEIVYYNRSPKDLPERQVEIDELVELSDIIFLALPMKAGLVLDANLIGKLRPDALFVSVSPMNLIDMTALSSRLLKGDVRAAIDWPSPSKELTALPLDRFYTVNSHSAYNTSSAIRHVTDAVVTRAIELL